jgi:hypothetical protein
VKVWIFHLTTNALTTSKFSPLGPPWPHFKGTARCPFLLLALPCVEIMR